LEDFVDINKIKTDKTGY